MLCLFMYTFINTLSACKHFHSNQQVWSESQHGSIFVLMNIYKNRILGSFTISAVAPPVYAQVAMALR